MNCNKMNKRTIFDVFKDYSCSGCKYNSYIETIKIGYRRINIYYLSSCLIRYNKTTVIKRAKLAFKDIMIDGFNRNSKNLFFWFELYDDFSNYYEIFDVLMDQGYQINIII